MHEIISVNARKEVRVHCQITVQFSVFHENYYGTCWNLAMHGMYVAFEGALELGAPIELSFVVSDEYPSFIEVSGKVAWLNVGENRIDADRPEGFGVEFVNIDEYSIAAIEKFITHS